MIDQQTTQTTLDRYASMINIADELDEHTLNKIAEFVYKNYVDDLESRQEWWHQLQDSLLIAKQIDDKKNTPWEGAANIKYPLITSAVLQFNSRTYPEIIKGDKVVNADIFGEDPTGALTDIAKRISLHMSYQLIEEMQPWEQETDRLLILLPLFGTVFKKIYYDFVNMKPVIELCSPEYLIVNHNIRSLEKADRISHIIYLNKNNVYENVVNGIYSDHNYEMELEDNEAIGHISDDGYIHYPPDKSAFIEQHTFYDLDNDGYDEPYIITIHARTRKVARIVARFEQQNIIRNNRGKLISIQADNYFIDYHFVPNVDGGFHSIGFGKLLYHMNHSVNTIFNNLIDAGTLANRGGGFIASTLGTKKGPYRFKIGEYIMLDTTLGTDLRASVFPLPRSEPSAVLFQLLGLLIQSTKELASITDIMQGQEEAQNAPATTVLALIEQGMKIYTSIQKRIYLALKKEFGKLYDMNRKYLTRQQLLEYNQAGLLNVNDYDIAAKFKIAPVADPQMASEAQRLAKAQALMQLYGRPEINNWAILDRYLRAIDISKEAEILPPPDPNAPPSPDVLKTMAETDLIKMKTANILMERELDAIRAQLTHMYNRIMGEDIANRGAKGKLDSIANLGQLELKGKEIDLQKLSQEAYIIRQQQAKPIALEKTAVAAEAQDILELLKQVELKVGLLKQAQAQSAGAAQGFQAPQGMPGAAAAPPGAQAPEQFAEMMQPQETMAEQQASPQQVAATQRIMGKVAEAGEE